MALIPHRDNRVGAVRQLAAVTGYQAARGLANAAGNQLRQIDYQQLYGNIRDQITRDVMRVTKRQRTNSGAPKYARKQAYDNRRTAGYMGQALKYYDTSARSLISNTGHLSTLHGTPAGLCAPAQGTGPTERIGRTIQVKSILFDCIVYGPAFASPPPGDTDDLMFTLYLVQDKQTNGTSVVTSTDVMEDSETIPLMNLENSDRFRILARQTKKLVKPPIATEPSVGGAQLVNSYRGNGYVHFRIYKKVNARVLMKGTTAGNVNVQDNGFFPILHCNRYLDNASVTQPTVSWRCRARFVG